MTKGQGVATRQSDSHDAVPHVYGAKSLSSATQASRPKRKNTRTQSRKTRIKNQPTLAERMTMVTLQHEEKSNHEFTKRLIHELERQDNDIYNKKDCVLSAKRHDWKKLVTATSITTLVVIATSWFLWTSPLATQPNGGQTASMITSVTSVLAMLPWTDSNGRQVLDIRQVGAVVVDVMALLPLLTRDDIVQYIQSKVLPSAWSTLQKMLLMEFWRRVWKFVGVQLSQLKERNSKDKEHWHRILPSWMNKTRVFFRDMFQRGSYKMMQRSVQQRVNAMVRDLVRVVLKHVATLFQHLVAIQTSEPISIAATAVS